MSQVLIKSITEIEDGKADAIIQQSMNVLSDAKITINSQEDYDTVASAVKLIKPILKEIDEAFDPSINAANLAHKAALAAKARYADPLKSADKAARSSMSVWVTAKEKQLAAARLKAEQDRKAKEDQDKADQIAEAETLADLGFGDLAGTLSEQVFIVPAAKVPDMPKTDGVSFVETWTYEILDELALPREYLMPDHAKLAKYTKAMKGMTNITGLKVSMTKEPRIR